MARNEQRRQKKLALKKAKRNEERRVIARAESSGISGGMALASRWPVVQARVSATLWDQGMGYAVLVRRGPGGLAAMAMFLLDVYCLGVKDVIAHVAPDHAISASVARVNDNGGQWIDVRYPSEYQFNKRPGALNIPLSEIRNAAGILERGREYVLYCQTGRRSSAAAFLLAQRGFTAYVLAGGLTTSSPS